MKRQGPQWTRDNVQRLTIGGKRGWFALLPESTVWCYLGKSKAECELSLRLLGQLVAMCRGSFRGVAGVMIQGGER